MDLPVAQKPAAPPLPGTEKVRRVAGILFLAAAFTMFALLMATHADALLDSDTSSEMLLANHMAGYYQHILSPTWYYSTELRVLNTQLVYMPLFRLCSSWYVVRAAGTVLLSGILLVCCGYFCRRAGLWKLFPFIGGFLLLPYSETYFRIVLYGTYYIPHICISFVMLGLLLRWTEATGRRRFAVAAAGLLLSVGAGMGGVRQLFIFYGPFFLAAALLWLRERRGPRARQTAALFWGSAAAAAAAVAGYGINKLVLTRLYRYDDYYTAIHFTGLSLDGVKKFLINWLDVLGWRSGALTEVWLHDLIAAVCILLVLLAFAHLLVHAKEQPFAVRVLVLFTVMAFVFLCGLYLFTDMVFSSRYLLPCAVFFVPIVCWYLYKNGANAGRAVLCLALMALLLLDSGGNYLQKAAAGESEYQKIAAVLTENGYCQGLTTFWYGNVMTEYANGVLECWVMDEGPGEITSPDMRYHWLTPIAHDWTHPEGKVFVALGKHDNACHIPAERFAESTVLYESDSSIVWGFDSYDQLLAQWGDAPAP